MNSANKIGITLCSLVLAACQTANNPPTMNVSPISIAPTATPTQEASSLPILESSPLPTLTSTPPLMLTPTPIVAPEGMVFFAGPANSMFSFYDSQGDPYTSCAVEFMLLSEQDAQRILEVEDEYLTRGAYFSDLQFLERFNILQANYVSQLRLLYLNYTSRMNQGEQETTLVEQYINDGTTLLRRYTSYVLGAMHDLGGPQYSQEYLNMLNEKVEEELSWRISSEDTLGVVTIRFLDIFTEEEYTGVMGSVQWEVYDAIQGDHISIAMNDESVCQELYLRSLNIEERRRSYILTELPPSATILERLGNPLFPTRVPN